MIITLKMIILGFLFLASGGSLFGRLFEGKLWLELLAGMVATVSFGYLAKDIIYQMVSQQVQQVTQEMARPVPPKPTTERVNPVPVTSAEPKLPDEITNPVPAKPPAERVNPVPVTSAEPKPPALSPKTFPIPSREVRSWQAHSGVICFGNCLAFTPDGQLLASGSWDDTIKLWQVSTGQLLNTLTGDAAVWVLSVAISPDGQWLASGSSDKTLKLWQVSTGQLLKTLTGHEDNVYSVAISPDGQWLASGSSDKTVKLWQVSTGQLLKTLTGHENSVWSVAFSPDGRLASGDFDGVIKLWE